MTVLMWVLNLDFAASAGESTAPTPVLSRQSGTFLVIGTGCWAMPIVAAVLALLGVR